ITYAPTFDRAPECMSSIVDHTQPIAIGNLLDRQDVARRPVYMNAKDPRRLSSDVLLDLGRIDVEGSRIDVAKDRLNAVPAQHVRSRRKAERSRDHLSRETQTLTGDNQRDRPVVEQREMPYTEGLPKLLLERRVRAAVVR